MGKTMNKEIKLTISEEAFRIIKDNCYAGGLAGNDGPLTHAWVKIIDAIIDGKTEVDLKTKKEREKELTSN